MGCTSLNHLHVKKLIYLIVEFPIWALANKHPRQFRFLVKIFYALAAHTCAEVMFPVLLLSGENHPVRGG